MPVYTVPINCSTAVSAQVDVFEIASGANRPVTLLGFEIAQTSEIGDAMEEQIELLLKRVTGAPTSGSGGPAAATVRAINPDESLAAGATFENGNTTKLTGGTSEELKRFSWNIRVPLLWVPIPESRPGILVSDHMVLEMVKTPADAIDKIVGWVEWME
jgi:hypothetical protein